jgi:hypothetical protein
MKTQSRVGINNIINIASKKKGSPLLKRQIYFTILNHFVQWYEEN